MALVLAGDTIERFEKLSKFDINGFVEGWRIFSLYHYVNLVDYYNGDVDTLNQESINLFNKLKSLSSQLEDIVINISQNLDRMDFWNLLEFLDEINTRIKVTSVISKFLRSSIYDGFNESSISNNYTTTDFDIPETIASKDRTDPQNDWVDIYVKNHVYETDYLAEKGGNNLQLGRQSLRSLNLESVVDNLIGERLYGIDIDKQFIYFDDDVVVLSPKDTARQSIITLAKVQKGDIPEFLQLGVSADVAIGSNLGLISIPFLVREMRETFSTDDTLLNFTVDNVGVEGSSLFVEYQVETFFNFIVKDNIEI